MVEPGIVLDKLSRRIKPAPRPIHDEHASLARPPPSGGDARAITAERRGSDVVLGHRGQWTSLMPFLNMALADRAGRQAAAAGQ